MRPIPTILCVFFAAIGGGLTVHALTLPPEPSPATQIVQTASEAVLPASAYAALPAQAGGTPVPSLAPMLERVTPAVVNIYTKQVIRSNTISIQEYFRGVRVPQQRISQSLGSGVIVDAKRGLILTNNHVVEGADEVSVILSDGRTFEAQPIGSDADTDIAVIRIQATNLVALPLADAKTLRVGDFVVAVGNPFGLGQTVTSGIISAVGRSGLQGFGYQNFIQTDASINPGNSGGPLFDQHGHVVGIATAIFSQSGGNIGIGFATPINLARAVVDQLRTSGRVVRGWLGVTIQPLGPDLRQALGLGDLEGALVADVTKNSPAERAGVKRGDVVVALNGKAVAEPGALSREIAMMRPGSEADLRILRDGHERTISVRIGELPDEQRPGESEELGAAPGSHGGRTVGSLGLALDALSDAARRQL
ncbi:MAG: Do family serine endopeptidase, partial [Methylocella sp.]